jgi:hypothetical protein
VENSRWRKSSMKMVIPFRILSGDRILDVIKYLHPNSDVISTYSKIYRLSLPENQQIQKEIPIKNSISRLQWLYRQNSLSLYPSINTDKNISSVYTERITMEKKRIKK